MTLSEDVATKRQPYAVLDLPSRDGKALKIERLLDLVHRKPPLRLLEIGTGAGGGAHHLAYRIEKAVV